MTVTGFWHGGITVSDTAASHRFYVDLLGLRLVADRTTDDPALLRVVGAPALALRVSMLAIPRSPSYVELVGYLGLPDRTRPDDALGLAVSTPSAVTCASTPTTARALGPAARYGGPGDQPGPGSTARRGFPGRGAALAHG
jgi:catechol 2,3-dioxygenase-like lactoylglutathione lyase family enzyme